jgi:hypothetical protein
MPFSSALCKSGSVDEKKLIAVLLNSLPVDEPLVRTVLGDYEG